MVTELDLLTRSTKGKQFTGYRGPTLFEGIQIPQDMSPRITVNQIIRQLDRSGFASINIIGIPGSGKSECANMLAHLLHQERKEFVILWCGSNELRHIKEFLQSLKKGMNYLIIFDDTSNALDSLSGEELSEAFQSYTRGRHEVMGKICPIMIYHYSKSHKKNFRAMALFNIYLSATATEKGNIKELIRGDTNALNRFSAFQRLYRTSFNEKFFDLDLGNGINRTFEDSNPFRIAYVLGPLGANIMLTKIMKCGMCMEKPLATYIEPDDIIEKGKHSHPNNWNLGLSLICFFKGEKDALPNELRSTLDFYLRVFADNTTDFHQLQNRLRKLRKTRNKRYYRKRTEEDEHYQELSKMVKRRVVDKRPNEVKIEESMETLFGEKPKPVEIGLEATSSN